jgi:hypothetical protein
MYRRVAISLTLAVHVLSLSHQPISSSSASSSSNIITPILSFSPDRFDGIYINESSIPSCKNKFNELLDNSLKEFKDNHRKGIWLRLPVDKLDLTSIAISKGFELHSCEKEYLMLTKWLPHTKSTIPNQPHNSCGIGCVCYDKKNKKLLVVKEKHGGISNIFKVPTGTASWNLFQSLISL